MDSTELRSKLYTVKPRLHDTTGCQTGLTTGLTNGFIVYTAGCQTVSQPGLITAWTNSCSFNTVVKKSPKMCRLRTIAQLCRAISLQLRHVSTIGKMLNSNISSTCPS